MTNRPALLLGLAVLALGPLGCGGDDDDNGSADAGSTADGPAGEADALPPVCDNLATMFGDLGAHNGVALSAPIDEGDPTGPQFLTFEVPLNQDAEPDVLFVELWDENVPFMDGFAPGSFGLVGIQADLFECGACVYIGANVDQGPLNFHMALGGTITIDTIDATPGTGNVTGSLANVAFREVTVDAGGQHVLEGGCQTSIEALTFDLTVQVAP